MEKQTTEECTIRYLSLEESKAIQETMKPKEEPTSVSVPLSREKQDYIKYLMFSALEDPREKLVKVNMDDIENYWKTRQGC
jgi:hypothetical protein